MITNLTLLGLIAGASDAQIEVMLPVIYPVIDISNWYSVDYQPNKKRKRLMRDAYLAMRRGQGEAMRHKLLARLEAAMAAGLINDSRYRNSSLNSTRSIRKSI
jgi:hypothetical protein